MCEILLCVENNQAEPADVIQSCSMWMSVDHSDGQTDGTDRMECARDVYIHWTAAHHTARLPSTTADRGRCDTSVGCLITAAWMDCFEGYWWTTAHWYAGRCLCRVSSNIAIRQLDMAAFTCDLECETSNGLSNSAVAHEMLHQNRAARCD